MPKQRTPIPLNLGLWNRRNSLAQPLGALKHARDAIIDEDTGSLRKRRAKVDLDGSAIGETGRGITQLQSRDGTVDKLAVHAGGTLYTADTSENPTFASHDTGIGDTGPTTFLVKDDTLYTSDGTTVRATDGTTARAAGLASGVEQVSSIVAASGSTISIASGYHFTWRYRDTASGVVSELANDSGRISYGSVLPATASSVNAFFLSGFPTAAPSGSTATSIDLFMTKDETVPSTFYFMGTYTLGDNPTLYPTTNVATAGVTMNNARLAYDGVRGASNFIWMAWGRLGNDEAADFEHRFTTFVGDGQTNEQRSDWQLSVTYLYYNVGSGTATPATVEYSTNSGGAWTEIEELVDSTTLIQSRTVTAALGASVDANAVQVRFVMTRGASGADDDHQVVAVDDIRIDAAGGGTSSIVIQNVPTGNEEFINAGNFGHFQVPPGRIFPITFEEHALGVLNSNGLFLAYSETGKPESFSTDVDLALFPNLIPFSDKEADDITGAEKVANQLVVMATDSVWRINHLPVVSDPSGATSTIFAEARSTVKRRVTDVVGCAGVKAYTRCQLNSDEDFVFFWSKRGPRLTDGFRVWQPADHVDWTHLSFDQSETVVRNFTFKERIYAVVRTTDASASDVAYVFHYDADSLAEMQKLAPGQLRFKVTGPHDPMTIADLTEVKLSSGEKILTGISNVTTGAEQGQTYIIERGAAGATDADDSSAPSFEWNTERIGSPGRTGHFDKVLFNVQEDANRTVTVGDTTTTPLLPVDKDAVEIGKAGQSLELAWDDDAVQSYVNADDEYENPANASPQSVSFTKPDRIINTATLFWDDGEESRD